MLFMQIIFVVSKEDLKIEPLIKEPVLTKNIIVILDI